MDMTLQQAAKLVTDVQVAHRLVVAYYERLLAGFNTVAAELQFDFWSWDPIETKRPCRRTVPPAKNWLWDMVPMYASSHLYRRVSGQRPQVGDLVLWLRAYSDDAFKEEKRRAAGVKGKPDPLKLAMGEGVIEVHLYRWVNDGEGDWDLTWDDLDDADPSIAGWQELGSDVLANAFHFKLADFIYSPEVLSGRIAALVSGTPLDGSQ